MQQRVAKITACFSHSVVTPLVFSNIVCIARRRKSHISLAKPENLQWPGDQNANFDLSADAKCTKSLFGRSPRADFGPGIKMQNLTADAKCTKSFFDEAREFALGRKTKCKI